MTTRHYFGTDGIRGVAGQHPMTAAFAFALGQAATEALKRQDLDKPLIVIGMDTRHSGPMLANAMSAGITARGGNVIFLGVIPTPGVSYLTRHLKADAGVVISASHNPFEDNGIKFFNDVGEKLSDNVELEIETLLEEQDLTPVTGNAIGRSSRYRRQEGDYESFLLSQSSSLEGLRIGLDCANGASYAIAPRVFQQLGARLDVMNAHPDGSNINVNCGSTHPEVMQRRVLDADLDVGISFDGDADRALLIDRQGRLVTGDHILAICARVRGEEAVVATLMTNLGTEQYLNEHDIELIRTKVGDRYVHEALRERSLRLGGEQSGHMLFLDKAPTGDGLLTALQTLAAVKHSRKPLEQWLDEIPVFPQILVNVRVNPEQKHAIAQNETVQKAVDEALAGLNGQGRINLRPSGTEPLIRVMVEGPDEASIQAAAQKVAQVVEKMA